MSPSIHRHHLLLAALLLAGAMGAAAQTTNSAGMANRSAAAPMAATASSGMRGSVSAGDRMFVDKAAMGGMAEVAAGKVAQQQGSSDQVKQFASRMVDDHTKANDELTQIATSKGIQPPAAPDKKAQADLAKLQKMSGATLDRAYMNMSGAAFDRAYMNQMLVDHKKTIALFTKEAKSGRDAELKGFAAKTLPTLKEHLQMAQTTSAAVRTGKAKG